MKNALFIILTSLFLVFATKQSDAQYYSYQKGIGVHFGIHRTGITFKNLINRDNAAGYEIGVYYDRSGLSNGIKTSMGGYVLNGKYTRKNSIFNPQLQLHLFVTYGAGVSVGYHMPGYYKIANGGSRLWYKGQISAGVDAMLGIEYKVLGLPLTVGVEANPFYDFLGRGPEFIDFVVPVRYIF